MIFELPSFLATYKRELFGMMSALLSIIAFVPYIFDTISGKTQPNRPCWIIWSALSTISFLSLAYEGASASLWFVGAQAGGTLLVCVLSIWFGIGHYLSRQNICVFAVASVGLVLWYLTDSAVYALMISIAISLMAGSITVIKTYKSPSSETTLTWVILWMSSVCAIFSVDDFRFILLAYPAYLLALYTAILGAKALAVLNSREPSTPFFLPS